MNLIKQKGSNLHLENNRQNFFERTPKDNHGPTRPPVAVVSGARDQDDFNSLTHGAAAAKVKSPVAQDDKDEDVEEEEMDLEKVDESLKM